MLEILLPIVYIVVGVALVWFVIELVMTVRKTRSTVDSLQKQLEPTLDSVQKITASLEPAVAKVDPLVERVSLTVDAANLELMRVDQILEDVSDITDSVSSTVNSVDTIASAPMELVTSVASKVRTAFRPKRASDESAKLGAARAAQAQQSVEKPKKTLGEVASTAKNVSTVAQGVASTVVSATQGAMSEQTKKFEDRKAASEAKAEARQAVMREASATADDMMNAVTASVAVDTAKMDAADVPAASPAAPAALDGDGSAEA
ncbi:DUF948 domain-containing protein [Adlercreutzia aquisgranensis]|nr:DUF948 domain-containing protein [Adlercreutzia aquisgranensis]